LRWVGVVGFALVASLYTVGIRLESNDSFCASCHVEPEATYFKQSFQSAQPVSLAAFHAGKNTRCIDCHSRKWLAGRLWAQWGGLQNLLAYQSGNYRTPSVTTRPVGDGGCSKCHSDITWVSERPGHYHSPWLRQRWRLADGPVNTCEVCHPSHTVVATESDRFMEIDRIEIQCDACHDETGTEKQPFNP
jgi:hypothetical protein